MPITRYSLIVCGVSLLPILLFVHWDGRIVRKIPVDSSYNQNTQEINKFWLRGEISPKASEEVYINIYSVDRYKIGWWTVTWLNFVKTTKASMDFVTEVGAGQYVIWPATYTLTNFYWPNPLIVTVRDHNPEKMVIKNMLQ